MTPPVPGFLGRVLDHAGAPAGTCFQVAPGVLVTAAHVLDDLGRAAPGAAVGVDPLAGGDARTAHVVAVDPRCDLAVLRASRALPATVPGFAATDTVPPGAAVILAGAGDLDDHEHTYRFVTASGAWRGATVRDGVALGRFGSPDVLRGMSGAPVCLEPDGSVVGVLSGRYNSADGWFVHSAWVSRTESLAALVGDVTTVALLDMSAPAVAWRERRAAHAAAMTRLAREQRDAFLVGNCGPPLVPAFVRAPGDEKDTTFPAAGLLTRTGDCALLGGPGAGKSRLLRSWAVELAADPARVPVLVGAGDLAAAIGSPLGPLGPVESLAAAVGTGLAAVGHDGLPWLAEWYATRPPDGVEWVVLVDGLDEVADDRLRDRVCSVLAALGTEPGWRGRVVVSSRPSTEDGGAAWPADRYELVALGVEQRAALVHGWFPGIGFPDPARAAGEFLAELDRRGLHDLAGIPLMLIILGQLFAYDHGRTLPDSRVAAYERIVAETHRRGPRGAGAAHEVLDWHDEHLAAAVAALHDRLGGVDGLLSRLAFERFAGRADSAVDWVCARTGELRATTRLSAGHWRVVVREALRHNRLLVAQGQDFRFVHATFPEFFAARHLARDRALSRELLGLVGPAGRDRRDALFMDWVFAFWSGWPPWTATLLRALDEDDPLPACVFVASLARRWVRLDEEVVAAARTRLHALLAGPPAGDPFLVPGLLAALGDPRGVDALVAIARDPRHGRACLHAGERLVAIGDDRGPDLLADAVEAFVTAPEPARFTDEEALTRREAAESLAHRRHPRATAVLERFLRDPRTADGRTRRYTFGLLGEHPEPHIADVVTALLTGVPVTDPREGQTRDRCVDVLLRMTDAGRDDRVARIAAAAGTVPGTTRARAAVDLAGRGDPRAGDLLAAVLPDVPDHPFDSTCQAVAWALAGLGDPRAVPPLVAVASRTGVIWHWQRQVKGAATNGSAATADVLAALARRPDLSPPHKAEVLLWLVLAGDPRGVDGAVHALDDPAMTGHLLTLADGLARRRDHRFTALLTRWVERLGTTDLDEEYRRWAERVLAAPERVLGDGLAADCATAPESNPHRRLVFLFDLFHTDHPRAVECLLAVHRDLETHPGRHRSVREHVVDLLAEQGNLAALPGLAERVRDPGRCTGDRTAALDRLTRLDGPEVADTLVALAPHVHRGDRWALSHKLLAMADPRAGAILAGWLVEEAAEWHFDGWDPKLDRLRELTDPHLVTAHEHLMEQHLSGRGELGVRRAVADVAGVGGPRAADLLTRWAADPRLPGEHRAAAVRALTAMGAVDADRAAELGRDLPPGPEPETGPTPARSQLEALLRFYGG